MSGMKNMFKWVCWLTPGLIKAIDIARGDTPRQAWVEERLRLDPIIKRTAKEEGIEWTDRPQVGKWERKKGTRRKKDD